jgi:hypothetical protein
MLVDGTSDLQAHITTSVSAHINEIQAQAQTLDASYTSGELSF